jgi:glycosyltransferase involved in cell wall biosynthesis
MISIIVIHRKNESAAVTLDSLAKQTYTEFVITTLEDIDGRGAPYARNRGFEKAPRHEYTLFSDNDICWEPDALEKMIFWINKPQAYLLGNSALLPSFCYGIYRIGEDKYFCAKKFDYEELKKENFISTMTLIRTCDYPGWDESIEKFQDWDLWLTMCEQGKFGVNCGHVIFSTPLRMDGITAKTSKDLILYAEIVKRKHGIICS